MSQETVNILKGILENNHDTMFGTYDFDGIAEDVIRLVNDKNRSPERTRGSRTASAGMYKHYIKHDLKSQAFSVNKVRKGAQK